MRDKILLVDDDTTLLRFIREYFTNQGFDVVTAASGADALRKAYQEHPSLVVLDVMMPGMDGWEVTTRLRELSDIPIILLTGKSTEADKLRGFQLGVDDYLTKPFSFAELTARVAAVLNRTHRRKTGPNNVILFAGLLLDLDRRELRRGDEVVPLTPTEYRLLEILARKQGAAVAENELIQEVWGKMETEETAAVRRYIWLLRQKIEPDPAHPSYILTVRGFGYRLEVNQARH
jgi:two-component system KDP operon response regulator KdpE